MAQRRRHYERAFEKYLREARIPYVAVDEAKRALLPEGARLRLEPRAGEQARTLKSFDFVVYGDGSNLLVEIKGRKAPRRRSATLGGRLECWVTLDDIDSLRTWARLFGDSFEPAFVFVYLCEDQPPDGLFDEVIEDAGRWYAVRAVMLDDYSRAMKTRSPKWRTVDLPAAAFERIARPFAPPPRPATPDHGPAEPSMARIA